MTPATLPQTMTFTGVPLGAPGTAAPSDEDLRARRRVWQETVSAWMSAAGITAANVRAVLAPGLTNALLRRPVFGLIAEGPKICELLQVRPSAFAEALCTALRWGSSHGGLGSVDRLIITRAVTDGLKPLAVARAIGINSATLRRTIYRGTVPDLPWEQVRRWLGRAPGTDWDAMVRHTQARQFCATQELVADTPSLRELLLAALASHQYRVSEWSARMGVPRMVVQRILNEGMAPLLRRNETALRNALGLAPAAYAAACRLLVQEGPLQTHASCLRDALRMRSQLQELLSRELAGLDGDVDQLAGLVGITVATLRTLLTQQACLPSLAVRVSLAAYFQLTYADVTKMCYTMTTGHPLRDDVIQRVARLDESGLRQVLTALQQVRP
jgi:hypothetical protein